MSANFKSLFWLDPEKSRRRKRESNPGSSAPEADALTTRPTRWSTSERQDGNRLLVAQRVVTGVLIITSLVWQTMIPDANRISPRWFALFTFGPVCHIRASQCPPPRWPSGKASASRAKEPEFESRLRRDFSGVEPYQWLKYWHSSGYPVRRLAL